MALHKYTGFDEETANTKMFDNAPASTSCVISSASSRSGVGMGARLTSGVLAQWNLVSSQATVVQGAAVRFNSVPNGNPLFILADGTADQVQLHANADGSLTITRASAAAITPTAGNVTSSPGLFSTSNWFYLEWKVTIADSGGTWEVRVNGVNVLSGTGDTKSSATNAFATRVFFQANGGATGVDIDDAYVLDTTGVRCNDFLGDVEAVLGTVNGDGYLQNSTPTGSLSRWQNVDEVPASSVDFNTLAAVGDLDAYLTDLALAGTGQVYAVAVSVDAAKTAAGTGTIALGIRSAGTNGFGSNIALTTAYALRQTIFETDPATGAAWTIAGVNAGIQALVKVTS